MKNGSNFQRKIWICRVSMSIVQVMLFFFFPLRIDGERTYSLRILLAVLTDTGVRIEYIMVLLSAGPALLNLFRMILMLRKRKEVLSRLSAITCGWLGMSVFAIEMFPNDYSGGEKPDLGNTFLLYGLILLVAGIEFLYCRYQETMEENGEQLRNELEQAKEEKQHERQVNQFPGKYPKEFYHVVWKMFYSGMKAQTLMMLSGMLVSAYLYIVLAMYGIMKDTYAIETGMTGDGLYGLFRNLGMILMIFSIVMMKMVTSWYMKEVKKDYRLLVVLGIRRRTVYIQFLLQFWIDAFVAGVIGLSAGGLGASILRSQLQKGVFNDIVFPEVVTLQYILKGGLAYLILMIFSLALNQENFIALAQSVDRNEDIQRENRLKKGIWAWLSGGAFLAVLAIAWYEIREWAESLYIHILTVLAVFLLLHGGMGFWLKHRQKREQYYRGLAKTNLFYHCFWSNIQRLFLLSVVQFLSMGVFAITLAGAWMPQRIGAMYPYDIVITAYEADIPDLEEIAVKYQADVKRYPMVRMTSIYGSDELRAWGTTRPIQWPQGQQIAISESTYQRMREFMGKEPKKLHLKGEEMHVVYQQDLSVKAHTIDWDTTRMEKHLRFGQPLEKYDTADFRNIFPVRTIRSEERGSLIGSFHQGMQDNLVVLSDSYFRENYEWITRYNRENWEVRQGITKEEWRRYTLSYPHNPTEGPTTLFCMNVKKDQMGQVAAELQYLKEEHAFDAIWDRNIQPFYLRPEMIINTKSEIFFTRIANGFILLILLILGLFQYFTKIKSEEDNWKSENIFLKRLGMYERERKAKLRYQLKFFMVLPMAIGILGGLVFAWLTAKARLYTPSEVLQFACRLMGIYLIWILIWVLVYLIIQYKQWKYVEKE